jgi:hypothetical protein
LTGGALGAALPPAASSGTPGRMSQAKTALVLLVVFFAGCAASRLIVPPARAGTSPQRWEYFCKHDWGDKDITSMANEAGQQGWELAAVGAEGSLPPTWCFKRPLP